MMIRKIFTNHLDENLMIKMINTKKPKKITIQTQNHHLKKFKRLFKRFKSKSKRFDG